MIAIARASLFNSFLDMLISLDFCLLVCCLGFLLQPGACLSSLGTTFGLLSTLLRCPLLPGNHTQGHVHHAEQSAEDRHCVALDLGPCVTEQEHVDLPA